MEPEFEPVTQEVSYRTIAGKLQWLTGLRPDIQYAVKEIARDSSDATRTSWIKVKHVLRYLKGTANYTQAFKQITTENMPSEIDVYADADWAGCSTTRRSTTGFVITINGNLAHSASRTQGTVAMSSAESELYALCSAAQEALFLRNLMMESGLGAQSMTINLYTDSSAAKSLVSRSGPGNKSKHIELKYLFLQEIIQDGQVRILKVGTHDNYATQGHVGRCSEPSWKIAGDSHLEYLPNSPETVLKQSERPGACP